MKAKLIGSLCSVLGMIFASSISRPAGAQESVQSLDVLRAFDTLENFYADAGRNVEYQMLTCAPVGKDSFDLRGKEWYVVYDVQSENFGLGFILYKVLGTVPTTRVLWIPKMFTPPWGNPGAPPKPVYFEENETKPGPAGGFFLYSTKRPKKGVIQITALWETQQVEIYIKQKVVKELNTVDESGNIVTFTTGWRVNSTVSP